MRYFYAGGNGGNGTIAMAFSTKKERDYFVAWRETYSNRRSLTRQAAKKIHGRALVVGETERNGCEKWVDL